VVGVDTIIKDFQFERYMNLLLINGPNLNLVGKREPSIYGSQTLDDIQEELLNLANELDVRLQFFQSNSESEMINCIHKSDGSIDGILINAGAYTHTSIALRDALLGVAIPFVEVHLSNIYSREKFRHKSFLADKALGLVAGFGPISYQLALQGIVSYLKRV
jgi:3-dehydroquinate dehydratase-2